MSSDPGNPCKSSSPYMMLQEDIQTILSTIDKSLHGSESGKLTKEQLREALDAFFLVGQPGGKTLNRFDEIMQAGSNTVPFHAHLGVLPGLKLSCLIPKEMRHGLTLS